MASVVMPLWNLTENFVVMPNLTVLSFFYFPIKCHKIKMRICRASFCFPMAKPNALSLYQKVELQSPLQRALDATIFFLLLALLAYRLHLVRTHGLCWLYAVAFLGESWFAFFWALTANITWTPVQYQTYPQRLLKR